MESDCKTERAQAARPPLSPLPNTLRCCPRDDTVCTYCGVSYLVLHEIADLEAKILLLEKNQDGEVEWARGALQAACQALVQRELSSARASAESRIQALAEVYDQERAETRDQQRQVLERARAVCEAAQKLAEKLFPSEDGASGGGNGGGGAWTALECLDCTSRCLAGLDDALRSTAATADELHAALRRARQAETELVQARVQSVGLQEEAERCRREAEHARREADQLTASLQEARTQAEALRTQVGEEAVQTARTRDKMRMLTGQAELWRGVARSLEEEKVVQEKMLSELKEQLRQLRVAKAVDPPPQRDEEEKRRVATECVSLRGALRDSHEEIASLRGQKIALQAALRRLESNAQRGAEERQALADALQKARQSHAIESERRCSLLAERGEERGVWQEERSWLVAERTRAEAESAALRNTCITLQVQAEQCARQCARMEDTVLRQCEERDALLRALPEPAQPAPVAVAAVPATASVPAAQTPPPPPASDPSRAVPVQPRHPGEAVGALHAAAVSVPPSAATAATPPHAPAGLNTCKSSPLLASPSTTTQCLGLVAAPAGLTSAPPTGPMGPTGPTGLYVQSAPLHRAATARLLPSVQVGGRCPRAACVPVQPVLPTMAFTIDASRPPNARRHAKKKNRK